ncbi:hypothetical protein [Mucilaginibacter sp. BT774]|uniref:hypothetical protein n=1 Tax=Mucilaginibacter sp. BT774 TaxID=3062276 RepID=UPI0026774D91|nr:hypothetical protein [Mucilaginibacter sp. BT774]MDO3628570.1 hypothetical protein [Mucilaginibacter sp. BT774]
MGEGRTFMMLLPVTYQNKELELEFDIQRGYVTRVGVKIGETVVIFEPDEEGNYRALVTLEEMAKAKELSIALLQAIASQLEKLSIG